jgi:hypothetical protein
MASSSNPPRVGEPVSDARLAPARRFIEASRARAYGRIVDVVREIGPAKLHTAEIEVLRGTADALLFARDVADEEARVALADAHTLARDLVSSERWTSERAADLLHDLRACGPAECSVLAEAA